MQIKSIKKIGKRPVYDISVKEAEHYVLENGVVTHNTGIYYTANTIFIITKSQEKDGTDLVGWNFTINIEKSRFVREKAKFQFTVLYGGGIQKYSGLLDLAVDIGMIKRPNIRSYTIPVITGDKPFTRKELENNSEIWNKLINTSEFKEAVYANYSYSTSTAVEEEEIKDLLRNQEDSTESEELFTEFGDPELAGNN